MDCHYENKPLSEENGEVNEEDSDYEPASWSDSRIEESITDNNDEEDSPPDSQETSDNSESDSDDEWANETLRGNVWDESEET